MKRKHTEKEKKNISEKLKIAHKEGKHPGWKHVNTDINKRSYPEKWFIKNIIQQYNLDKKYTIKEKMSFSKYFLDFAFLELKLDVEIDGQQHFRTKESIEHDKIRDKYLIDNGWNVYRIAWLEIKNDINLSASLFLDFLNKTSSYRTYNIEEVMQYFKKYKPKYGKRKDYNEAIKKQTDIKNAEKIKELLNSNINFSKFGWVHKASKIIECSDQHVNKFMKRYLLEFYNEKCFKRKPTK